MTRLKVELSVFLNIYRSVAERKYDRRLYRIVKKDDTSVFLTCWHYETVSEVYFFW